MIERSHIFYTLHAPFCGRSYIITRDTAGAGEGIYNLLNLTGFDISAALTRIYVICHSEPFAPLKDRLREESRACNRPKSHAKARCFAALSMTA